VILINKWHKLKQNITGFAWSWWSNLSK